VWSGPSGVGGEDDLGARRGKKVQRGVGRQVYVGVLLRGGGWRGEGDTHTV